MVGQQVFYCGTGFRMGFFFFFGQTYEHLIDVFSCEGYEA